MPSPRALLALTLLLPQVPLAATSPATAAPPANSCADPYWTYSLRCQWAPTEPPQANAGSAPAAAADVRAFTRVRRERGRVRARVDGEPRHR